MRLIFLKLDENAKRQRKRTLRRQHEPLEELSFLFNRLASLKLDYPEIGRYVWNSTLLFGVSGALVTALENQSEKFLAKSYPQPHQVSKVSSLWPTRIM
jgi:hypothetical protein